MFIHCEASNAVVRPANTCMETRLNKFITRQLDVQCIGKCIINTMNRTLMLKDLQSKAAMR